jgi:hypothetical protein
MFVPAVDTHQTAYVYASVMVTRSLHDSSVARDNVTDFSGGVVDKLKSQRFLWLLSNTPLLQSSRQSLPISASMDGRPTSSSGSSESMFVTMI